MLAIWSVHEYVNLANEWAVQPVDSLVSCTPEDVLKFDADEEGVGGDDAADAFRYLVATKARAVVARKLAGI